MSRKLQLDKRCYIKVNKHDKGQNDNDMTYFYFLHQFLFSYDYFNILKWCGINIDL